MGQLLTDLLDQYDFWRAGTDAASQPSGVLLISSGGVGDTLLFRLMVPRFEALLRPGETLHLVTRSDSRPVAFLFPDGVQIHAYDYPKFLRDRAYRRTVCRELRALNVRVAASTDHLRHPLIDDVMARATNAPEKFALAPRSWPKYDKLLHRYARQYDPLVDVPDTMEHRLIRWWHLANTVSGNEQPVPRVRLPQDALPAPDVGEKPRVMLHPFSAILERQYPVETFQAIIKSLPSDVEVLLSCGPGDLDRNPDFRTLLADDRVVEDTSSLEAKAATLQTVKLLVSIDTSVMHLGVLCGAPTLCLASAAHVIDSIPYDDRMTPDNVTFLYHDMDCRMCLGQCVLPLEGNRYPCIARMDTQTIVDAVTASFKKPA